MRRLNSLLSKDIIHLATTFILVVSLIFSAISARSARELAEINARRLETEQSRHELTKQRLWQVQEALRLGVGNSQEAP